jgi:hypothetical protein
MARNKSVCAPLTVVADTSTPERSRGLAKPGPDKVPLKLKKTLSPSVMLAPLLMSGTANALSAGRGCSGGWELDNPWISHVDLQPRSVGSEVTRRWLGGALSNYTEDGASRRRTTPDRRRIERATVLEGTR